MHDASNIEYRQSMIFNDKLPSCGTPLGLGWGLWLGLGLSLGLESMLVYRAQLLYDFDLGLKLES